MSRLMSVALTEQAVRDRAKTQTRRLGWAYLKPGERLTLVRKAMGRKRPDGTVEPLVRICNVEVVDARREQLDSITPEDCAAEGFPQFTPQQFVEFFCEHMRCTPDTWVTRVTWQYLPEATGV
jgi:hypothetical protein